jgi:hypothetical protein
MSNGRDYLSPEQEARLAERSKQIEQEFQNRAPERARVAEETKRTMEARIDAERPLALERTRQIQKENDEKKENIISDWLEMNPTFIKNDKTTMIPNGKKIAVLVSNNVNIVTTKQVLHFPNFYMGQEIIAVERSGGRKTKRRRSRKSKKSKQN